MGKSLPLNFLLLLACFGAVLIGVPVEAEDSDEEILVGRIAHVEGKLLRYIDEENDWVLTVKDSPFGLEDALYSGEKARAEFIMPNRTWLRIGPNTQLQLIALNRETTTIDVASGLARLYNKSDDTLIKVTTPFGYVVAPDGAAFDLYVGDESLEVIALSGDVEFVHDGTKAKYHVREGSSSIIADEVETARGNGAVDAEWDDWNAERDEVWEDRLRQSEYSAGFLPAALQEESHVLEENGRWERIRYEGEYRDMWRPTRVESGWRPFTAGRWTVYYGDNCWIPDESFGYVTHHYGSWIYVDSFHSWYWMPPVARFVAPRSSIGFGWYPGRVGWIHSGPSIGWVPLAPNEVYYGFRRWGRHTTVVTPTTAINININIGGYRYIDEAVVVHRDQFYRGSRYTPVYERNIKRDVIIKNYQPTTIINNTVINNIQIDRRRHTYNDIEPVRKPHSMVINRIDDNRRMSRGIDDAGRKRIERDLTRFKAREEPPLKVELPRPMLASKIVAVENIAAPLHSLALEKKEIKPKSRERERPIHVAADKRSRLAEQGRLDQTGERARPEDKGKSKISKDSPGEEVQKMRPPQDDLERKHEEPGVRSPRRQQPEQILNPREGVSQQDNMEKGKTKEERFQDEPGVRQEEKSRLRSPRDKGRSEPEQNISGQDKEKAPQENTVRQEQKVRRPPQDENRRQQEFEANGRQEEAVLKPQEKTPPQEKLTRRGPKEEELRPQQEPGQPEEKPRLKSPRDKGAPETRQNLSPKERIRQVGENQEQELKQEKKNQQVEAQRQQDQEKQGRQQQEKQLRQEQEQRQQKEDQQLQQREEKQRQQKVEAQRQQDQEKQVRQQQEKQLRQEQEQRQQKEEQQVQQRQRKQQQQQESAAIAQAQQEQASKKKKKQQEEELLPGQQPNPK